MKKPSQKPKTRAASRDRHEPAARVCVACHKLPKFCGCAPDAVATCPICGKPQEEGRHYPEVDCFAHKGQP